MCNSPTGYEAVYASERGTPHSVLPVVSVDSEGHAQVFAETGRLVRADSLAGFTHVRSAG